MITKAVVEGIVPPNKFKVRIPIFNGIEGAQKYTPFNDLPEATLCTLPGVDNVISVGDIVYVSFEDNNNARPIILGHLYTKGGSTSKSSLDIIARTLKIFDDGVSSVSLPNTTTIGKIPASVLTDLLLWWRNSDYSQPLPTTSRIIITPASLPAVGNSNILYISTSTKKCYIWSSEETSYQCVGSNYNEITEINGGTSNV